MVLLLNYLPYLFIALGIYLCFFFAKKYRGTDKVGKSIVITILATIASWFILAALTASYMPKGTVARIAPPDFTQDVATAPKVENRLLNTVKPKEEAKKDFDEMVDWRTAKAKRDGTYVPPEVLAKAITNADNANNNAAVREFQLEQEKTLLNNVQKTETQELPLPAKQ